MLYQSAKDWHAASHKNVLLFGMSGLGKTHLSNMLRAEGGWFHYSIDYRIGTRYMGEHIADSFKREAMKVGYLRDLLLSDSIYIGSNITFENLNSYKWYRIKFIENFFKDGNVNSGGNKKLSINNIKFYSN